MRVGVFLPVLFFFVGICLSSSSPSSPLSASPSRFTTKQKTFTKALRSLISFSSSSSPQEREGTGEEEEEEEGSWNEWAISATNEIISLGILVVRAPIVNLLPGGSSTDIFRENPPHWPKNEDVDLDSLPSEDESNDVWEQLSSNYASFFQSMNIPATLDAMFGEVVVGHVSQNDPQTLQRYQRAQNYLGKSGLFSQPSLLAGTSSLPSSSSSSSSSSSQKTFQKKVEEFKERIGKVVEEERQKELKKRSGKREEDDEEVCGGVGLEILVEDWNSTDATDDIFFSTDSDATEMRKECLCPADYEGENCENYRQFSCDFTLLEPQPKCQPTDFGVNYDGSPVCFLNSLKDKISLVYEMECRFNTPPVELEDDPFEYKIYNLEEKEEDNDDFESDGEDTEEAEETVIFALSSHRNDIFTAFLKVFNFNRFGDLNASQAVALSLDQISGDETIKLDLDFSKLDEKRYIFGGRLYIEMGLQSVANGAAAMVNGLNKNMRNKKHFDFVDSTLRSPTIDYTAAGWQRFLLLYIALGISGVLFVVYWSNRCVKYLAKVDKED